MTTNGVVWGVIRVDVGVAGLFWASETSKQSQIN
jgi:hypothetical protein